MPSDDRERSFENALASHLRADNSAGVSRAACADAETLAAYHERSLPQEQMTSLQAHVADCERCQEILAHLGATDEIPVAVANTTPQAPPAATHDAKSAVLVLHARRRALWRWVAPAGALAAALLVWVAVHENGSVRVPPQLPSAAPKQSETAKNLPASPPALTYAPSLDATSKNENAFADALSALNTAPQSKIAGAARQRPQSLLKEKVSASAKKQSSVRDDFGQLAGRSLSTNALPAPDEGLKSKTETRTGEAATEVAGVEPEAKAANVQRGALTSRPQIPPERGAVAAAAPVAPPPPAPSARTEPSRPRAAAVAGAVQQEQQLEATPRFKSNAGVRLANTVAEITISSPSGLSSWQVGPAGAIEFSSDAGKTWTVQPSGVIADLLAGSAPSDKVCWIVGRSGTILRTTDGGAHWQRLRPPVQDDLRSVSAADAQHATVSSTNGAYQTTDGGATWNKVAPE